MTVRARTLILLVVAALLGGCSASSRQIKALAQDEDAGRRAAAAEALGKLTLTGDKLDRAVDALAAATTDPSPAVRLAAIEALGKLGGERATQALIDSLRGANFGHAALASFQVANNLGGESPEVLIGLARSQTEQGDETSLDEAALTLNRLASVLEGLGPQVMQQHIYSLKFGYDNLKMKYEQLDLTEKAAALEPKIAAAEAKIEELNASGAGGGGLPFTMP